MECIKVLELDNMPTHKQMNDFYQDNGLSCKLSKKPEWKKRIMKELDLEMRESETKVGWKYEERAEEILREKGYDVQKMTTGCHFDFLINENVKIDVKVGKRWYIDDYQANSFGINKKYATCDVYMMFALDDEEKVERLLIIPSSKVQSSTMTIGKNSKYNIWINRFDVIDRYSQFLREAF